MLAKLKKNLSQEATATSSYLPNNQIIHGVEAGIMRPYSSSVWTREDFDTYKIVPHYTGGNINDCWIPGEGSDNQPGEKWVIFSSHYPVRIHGIKTRGRFNAAQFVRSYLIYYSSDMVNWHRPSFKNHFFGNTNNISWVENKFTSSIYAKAIKIVPTSFTSVMAMKVELMISNPNIIVRQEMPKEIPVIRNGLANIYYFKCFSSM